MIMPSQMSFKDNSHGTVAKTNLLTLKQDRVHNTAASF